MLRQGAQNPAFDLEKSEISSKSGSPQLSTLAKTPEFSYCKITR